MDEKTEELRDIFIDVTDEETVTESQEETPGSLTDETEGVEDRLRSVVSRMRERYEFGTDLGDGDLVTLVELFYDGESDATIARELDVSRKVAFRARLDLHLVRDRDTDAPFDLAALRERLTDDPSTAELADEFDVSESTVRRYRRVVRAQNESRGANDRYRDEFDRLLADGDLSGGLTEDVQEDGLADATEGMETDVDF
ncbi:conditioned medium-induced protein 4 [Halostella litorea]|uniref:conditioned medium-induced protein 4 n=1 Tax=Halostella litorea TaxID=2528831 RepID=UPI0010928044|nr:conditioned medium-induced protein 4 [Halostella litorea]